MILNDPFDYGRRGSTAGQSAGNVSWDDTMSDIDEFIIVAEGMTRLGEDRVQQEMELGMCGRGRREVGEGD